MKILTIHIQTISFVSSSTDAFNYLAVFLGWLEKFVFLIETKKTQ